MNRKSFLQTLGIGTLVGAAVVNSESKEMPSPAEGPVLHKPEPKQKQSADNGEPILIECLSIDITEDWERDLWGDDRRVEVRKSAKITGVPISEFESLAEKAQYMHEQTYIFKAGKHEHKMTGYIHMITVDMHSDDGVVLNVIQSTVEYVNSTTNFSKTPHFHSMFI